MVSMTVSSNFAVATLFRNFFTKALLGNFLCLAALLLVGIYFVSICGNFKSGLFATSLFQHRMLCNFFSSRTISNPINNKFFFKKSDKFKQDCIRLFVIIESNSKWLEERIMPPRNLKQRCAICDQVRQVNVKSTSAIFEKPIGKAKRS